MCIGKYYPATSCYKGGKVTFNFGPDFVFPPPEGSSPFCNAQSLNFTSKLQQEEQEEQVLLKRWMDAPPEEEEEEEEIQNNDMNSMNSMKS